MTNLCVRGGQAFASVHPDESVSLDGDVELQELRLVDVELRPPEHTCKETSRIRFYRLHFLLNLPLLIYLDALFGPSLSSC